MTEFKITSHFFKENFILQMLMFNILLYISFLCSFQSLIMHRLQYNYIGQSNCLAFLHIICVKLCMQSVCSTACTSGINNSFSYQFCYVIILPCSVACGMFCFCFSVPADVFSSDLHALKSIHHTNFPSPTINHRNDILLAWEMGIEISLVMSATN